MTSLFTNSVVDTLANAINFVKVMEKIKVCCTEPTNLLPVVYL